MRNGDSSLDRLLDSVAEEIGFEAAAFARYHAEKKALAFLLRGDAESIRIFVSLRMCRDCHAFFAAVSRRHAQLEIECVDPNTRHTFRNGQCSCGK